MLEHPNHLNWATTGRRTAAPELAASQTGAVQKSTDCVAVPQELVDGIATGLTVDGGGSLRNAFAVRSKDYEKLWMVAAEIEGEGLEDASTVAVWAKSGDLAVGGGLIFAMEPLAKEFSDWGDGSTSDAKLTSQDHGVAEARRCVEDSLR